MTRDYDMRAPKVHECPSCHGAGKFTDRDEDGEFICECAVCAGSGECITCPGCANDVPASEGVPCAECRAEWAQEDERAHERAHAMGVLR